MPILVSIIISLFFSFSPLPFISNIFWQEIDWPKFEKGEIVNINESKYYANRIRPDKYPEISAQSAALLKSRNKSLLFEKNADEVLSIASISKMMSILVLLDDLNLDLEKYYIIKESDKRNGGRQHLFTGDEVRVADLLALSLIPSENTAVVAMISSLGLNETDFVQKMNDKAKSLSLNNTVFFDSTGLDPRNVSTAKEVAVFLQKALNIKEVQDLAKNDKYKFTTKQGSTRQIFSTNELLSYNFPEEYNVKVLGGKTGFNESAGYCFASKFLLADEEYISVVLNSSTLKNRFSDTRKIIEKLHLSFQANN